jgi:Pyruvate/2-oxoacid:ferredoxin oxidoreductase gamma subunit
MHIHIGLLHGLVIFANVVVFGFFWRLLAMKFSQSVIGQAMGFIY